MIILKSYLSKIKKPFLLISCVISILLLGYIDFVSGIEFSFSLFYLIPIMIATWTRGSLKGFLCAIIASIIWYVAEKLGDRNYSNFLYPYWNTIMRFAFYSIVILLIQKINKLHKKTEEHSKIDYLTGFHNIRSLYERLSQEKERFLRTKRYFSLAYIDIDNFKQGAL